MSVISNLGISVEYSGYKHEFSEPVGLSDYFLHVLGVLVFVLYHVSNNEPDIEEASSEESNGEDVMEGSVVVHVEESNAWEGNS